VRNKEHVSKTQLYVFVSSVTSYIAKNYRKRMYTDFLINAVHHAHFSSVLLCVKLCTKKLKTLTGVISKGLLVSASFEPELKHSTRNERGHAILWMLNEQGHAFTHYNSCIGQITLAFICKYYYYVLVPTLLLAIKITLVH